VPKKNHTYLFQPGLWYVEGVFLDKDDVQHRQTGQLVIVHSPDLWTIDSMLNISGEDTRDFQTRYEINPPLADKSEMEWKSLSSGPEPIYGLFVVVDDVIMMPWQSRSGAYWGHETLIRLTNSEYLSRGFGYIQNVKVSSWSVKLTRAESGEPESSAGQTIN
jgi:hypothetical protein